MHWKSCACGTAVVSSDESAGWAAQGLSRYASTSAVRPSRHLDISAAKQCEPVQCGQHQLIFNHASINEMLIIKGNYDDTSMTKFQIIVMFNDVLSTSQTWK